MGTTATAQRDVIKGQLEAFVDGRRFAVVQGRRWTRVHEYLSNGQLTARWFYDLATGEAREAEGARKPRSWRLGGAATAFVARVVAAAVPVAEPSSERTLTAAGESRRDWMKVGERFSVPYRAAVEEQIAGLTWRTDHQAAMMPAMGINECIRELRIPKVSGYATDGYLQVPDRDEGTAHYSIYGIEGNYSNGRVRLYVLDTGTEMVPLAADHWPAG